MKSNKVYTVEEILIAAGIENPGEVVGKVRVRIGGIAVRDLDHTIFVSPTDKLEILVGEETFEVPLTEGEEGAISEGAQAVREQEGREESAKAEELAKAKADGKAIGLPSETPE